MSKKRWRSFHSESGQAIVLVALAIVAIIAMASLAIDGGYAYAQKRKLQDAVDLAALAGARALGMGATEDEIAQVINYYATTNGAQSVSYVLVDANGQPTGNIDDARGVSVTGQVTFPTFMAGIVGISSMTATATGGAELYGLSSAGNLLPMAVHEADFEYNVVYELWDDNHEAPGAFGWVDWDGGGGGANELADNIANPANSGVWHVGDLVPAEPGVKASALVRNALNLWRNRNVTVILYDDISGQGSNTRYRISGFAEFVLVDYRLQGNDKRVWGYFIRHVAQGEPGGPDFGLQGIKLK